MNGDAVGAGSLANAGGFDRIGFAPPASAAVIALPLAVGVALVRAVTSRAEKVHATLRCLRLCRLHVDLPMCLRFDAAVS